MLKSWGFCYVVSGLKGPDGLHRFLRTEASAEKYFDEILDEVMVNEIAPHGCGIEHEFGYTFTLDKSEEALRVAKEELKRDIRSQ